MDILRLLETGGIRKPARYIGNEKNSIHKDWDGIPFRIALSYPDLYEVGMSNLGLQILYHIINNQPDCLAERVFAPGADLENQLTTCNLRLTTLESQRPIKDFDLLGFSLGHELTYTNIITILKLGGIPLHSCERKDSEPLVMGGGPCVFNPEPIALFFDLFFIGEAEEGILEVLDVIRKNKGQSRKVVLEKMAGIPGVYVPGISKTAIKRFVKDLNPIPYPLNPIIPFIEAIHDRAALEIMRGCKWGCKFCQAGWTSLPVRERKKELLIDMADKLLANTGHNELSLLSLSSSDYKEIDELAKILAVKYEKQKINLALPSMRTNSFSVKLAKEIARVRVSSVTLAPEAGTQRLRDKIGKNMTEENILAGAGSAFEEGIEAIKLYFMIGLPTETEADLRGICDLSQKIYALGKTFCRRLRITVNISTFIPKPHTPLQWERQISIEETLAKQKIIKHSLQSSRIEVRWHQAEASFLEGVFSRGDGRLSAVIEKAWELGARLDAWSEHFKFGLWEKAFADCGIDPNHYLKNREENLPLPWDHINVGIPKEALKNAAHKN